MSITANRAGILPAVRTRLFGERDAVGDQLRDIARQGSGMARLAHACALLLIVLFSAGSLVALGGDALTRILARGAPVAADLPDAIAVGVSTLLVFAMDVGMVYAASMLRVLAARQAGRREQAVHWVVLGAVAILEASTYAYMSALYEHPVGPVAWALIAARALAAPLLGVYLSLARPLPVGPRDILHEVEMASGAGVIRDVVTIARDPSAPLARKAAIFNAAAAMTPADRDRLAGLLDVVAGDPVPVVVAAPPMGAYPDPDEGDDDGDGPTLALVPPTRPLGARQAARRRANRKDMRTEAVEARARAMWRPGMSVTQLERAAGIARSVAAKYRRVFEAEAARLAQEVAVGQ